MLSLTVHVVINWAWLFSPRDDDVDRLTPRKREFLGTTYDVYLHSDTLLHRKSGRNSKLIKSYIFVPQIFA